jgi:NifU-like protein involved in Fe-S cluster formation
MNGMDEAVIQYYRRLLKTGFEHAGSLENSSIFLDTVRQNIPICGQASDYLQIFIQVNDGVIDDIRYLCSCDPTTNVAVEILCHLVKGRTLDFTDALTEDQFFQALGGKSEDLSKKIKGLLELLHQGLNRYQTNTA